MTQPFNTAGDGQPAGPAPDTTAAGSRTAGGTGPGVPLSIWPGLPAPGDARDGQPCGGPVTAAAARRVIDAFSLPGDLVAAAGGSPAVTEAAAAAGRRVLALVPGPAPARQRPGVPAALPPPGTPPPGRPGWPSPAAAAPAAAVGSRAARPGRAGPGPVFAACERVLRPGGVLAVITGPAAPGGTPPAPPGASSPPPARPAWSTPSTSSWSAPPSTATASPPPPPIPAPPRPAAARSHDDLLVFTKPGGGARS